MLNRREFLAAGACAFGLSAVPFAFAADATGDPQQWVMESSINIRKASKNDNELATI